jgi:hypothetical protein
VDTRQGGLDLRSLIGEEEAVLLVAERGRVGEQMVGAGKEIVSGAQRAEIVGPPRINAERKDPGGAEFTDRLEDMPVMSRRITGMNNPPDIDRKVPKIVRVSPK